jgi:hypothetical protein
MSAQPAHDTFEELFWQVQGVFDPDGQEPDFSYTIGLHDRGLPELHLWAQPDEGEDPGADWVLNTSDRGHLLNELARLAVRGRLGVGAELERRYDAGRTTLRFRVGPPADREVLEAYGIAPDASVLPVHWSLHRAPEGPRGAMTPEQEHAAASAYDEITAGLVEGRRAPTGWTLPRTPSFAPEQRFGPRTPVVLARAAQLWQADDETLADLLYAALLVESAGMSLTNPVAVAGALAREVGRSRCLADLHDDVEGLVSWLTTRPAARARWRRVVRTFDPEGWAAVAPDGRDGMARACAGLLRDLLGMCLSFEVVADVADDDLLLSARGPWLSGLRRGAPVPGDAWSAAPDVLAAVADLLAQLDVESLGTVAGIHQIAMTRGIREAPGYAALCQRLRGWALVSAAGCPWEPTLSSLPGWRPLLEAVPHGVVAPLAPLQAWATCVSSALTHRWRLSGADVRTLAAPFRQDLPLLERRLNAPV